MPAINEVVFRSTAACRRFLLLLHPLCLPCLGVLGCIFHTFIWLVFCLFFLYLNTILRPPRCCDNLINATTFFSSPTKVQSLPLLYSPSNAYYYNYCYCYYYCYYYYCCCCCCYYILLYYYYYYYYYIRVINKIGPPHSGSLICLIFVFILFFVTTDRIGRHEVLLPINHNYNKLVIF